MQQKGLKWGQILDILQVNGLQKKRRVQFKYDPLHIMQSFIMFLVYEHLSATAAKQVGSALLQFHLIPGQNCNTAEQIMSCGK
jgi:hypothetical protein